MTNLGDLLGNMADKLAQDNLNVGDVHLLNLDQKNGITPKAGDATRNKFFIILGFDNEGNVILTEGLVLQEKTIWKKFLERDIISESNSCELYFEEKNIEAFVEKLDNLYPDVKYVNRLMTHSWGQKVLRFYDLDGNLIEVGTPM